MFTGPPKYVMRAAWSSLHDHWKNTYVTNRACHITRYYRALVNFKRSWHHRGDIVVWLDLWLVAAEPAVRSVDFPSAVHFSHELAIWQWLFNAPSAFHFTATFHHYSMQRRAFLSAKSVTARCCKCALIYRSDSWSGIVKPEIFA